MRRWGLFVHRHRWAVLIVCGVFFVALVVALLDGGELKNASDFNVESVRASRLESNQLAAATGTSFLLFFTDSQHSSSDPQFQQAVQDALAPLARDRRVASIKTPYNATATTAAAMVSTDKHSVFSVVNLSIDFASARQQYPVLRGEVHSSTVRTSSAAGADNPGAWLDSRSDGAGHREHGLRP